MSLSVTRSEQRIYWESDPVTFYGWYLSTSGDSADFHPWREPGQRAGFIKAMAERLPTLDDWQIEEVAAAAALEAWGHREDDRQLGRDVLAEILGDDPVVLDAIDELCEEWAS